jgi:anti-sigma factor (TIGR02949 family)
MSCELVERDLDAYLDRELEADASAAVREHISKCPACRRQVAEREALSKLVRGAPYYVAPDRLRARVFAQATRSNSLWRALPWAAAAAMLVVAVAVGAMMWRPASSRGNTIADEVVSNHVRSLLASHIFDVQSTDLHTVKPWFLGKLDFSPPVVDLASIGFPLVGGRLDYVAGRTVAALVYQRQKHTINVFVCPDDDSFPRELVVTVRGFNVRHWVHNRMSFWAVSDLNGAELRQFASALGAP